MKRKKLIEDAKLAHVGSGGDLVENYKFHVVGRGTNQKVIKIKRQN